jgi:hypothetical protein
MIVNHLTKVEKGIIKERIVTKETGIGIETVRYLTIEKEIEKEVKIDTEIMTEKTEKNGVKRRDFSVEIVVTTEEEMMTGKGNMTKRNLHGEMKRMIEITEEEGTNYPRQLF